MTKEEALEVLREFRMWRRGDGKYERSETPFAYSPKEVGIAIDVAIKTLNKEVGK